MRTLLEVKTQIAELMAFRATATTTPREVSKVRKRIQFLKMAELYIEGTPSDDFVSKEINRLEKRIILLNEAFSIDKYPGELEKDARKKYEREMGIPHYRDQIRALRFIKK